MNKGNKSVDNKSKFLNSAEQMAENLGPALGLEVEQSTFYKYHYCSDWRNQGVMTREIDVIRQQEG